MKNKITECENGFTLIETMVAMAIFTIGILGLFGMQTSAIKGNLSANSITTGTTWAADRVEYLLGLSYSDEELSVTGACSALPKSAADAASLPNKNTFPIVNENHIGYTVYWAVAKDCMLSNIPDTSDEEEQKPKTLRIIVTRDTGNGETELAILTYMKQNGKIEE
ncbi:prepilin-type N-terminal cleavage/methylation domain-containing protein [Desulfobulbus sp. TB]|nr:prepilin-type N-terminal cleavage/methylation domain-containing protein [Desulfobulbus sp. TB]